MPQLVTDHVKMDVEPGFLNDFIELKEMIKLMERPDAGFFHVLRLMAIERASFFECQANDKIIKNNHKWFPYASKYFLLNL